CALEEISPAANVTDHGAPACEALTGLSAAVELTVARTVHEPACAALTGLSVAVDGSTARIAQSATEEGPPASRTTRANSVLAGAAALTTANPFEVCGSPMTRISCCSLVEPRGMTTVPTLNVMVEDSSPAILPKVMPISYPTAGSRTRGTPIRPAGSGRDSRGPAAHRGPTASRANAGTCSPRGSVRISLRGCNRATLTVD